MNMREDRVYRDWRGNRYQLTCSLDGKPTFFEAYGPFRSGHQGLVPHLLINGSDWWGFGLNWDDAVREFLRNIDAVLVNAKGHNHGKR
jgi:hypothetical protein